MKENILIISNSKREIPYSDILNFYKLDIEKSFNKSFVLENNFKLCILDFDKKENMIRYAKLLRNILPSIPLLLIDNFKTPMEHKLLSNINGYGQTQILHWRATNPEELLISVQTLLNPEYPVSKYDIAIILPVYNEESRFKNVYNFIQKLKNLLEESFINISIYFVNDGSKDYTQGLINSFISKYKNETNYISEKSFFTSYELDYNTRKAGTYIKGIQSISADLYLFVDADDSFMVDDISSIINIMKEGYYDMVVGTKDLTAENRPPIRRVMSFFKRLLTKPLLPKGIYDSQTGLKALSKNAAQYILPHLHENTGLAIDLEMLYLAKRFNFRVLQLPVTCIDRDGSHVNIVKDSINFIKSIFSIYFKNKNIKN